MALSLFWKLAGTNPFQRFLIFPTFTPTPRNSTFMLAFLCLLAYSLLNKGFHGFFCMVEASFTFLVKKIPSFSSLTQILHSQKVKKAEEMFAIQAKLYVLLYQRFAEGEFPLCCNINNFQGYGCYHNRKYTLHKTV